MLVLLFLCICSLVQGQDSTLYAKLHNLPDKLFSKINKKSQDLERKLDRQTEKYLAKLEKQEKKMRQKLWKKDSAAAKALFGDVAARYSKLQNSSSLQNVYSGHLDSMQTAVGFLEQSAAVASLSERYKSALDNYGQLQEKLNYAAEVQRQLKERQQYLKEQLQKLGLAKEFKKFQKDVYYYRAQVDEYKRILDDPSKLEAKLLQLANKIPAFKEFFAKHSMLASMFRLPGNDPVASAAPIPGLQTRASIQQNMLQRFGSGPDVSRAMQQNIQSAQAQINQLKDKVTKLGGGSSEMDMPDFKPNSQKTKSFWNRIELGANVQSARSNGYFPVTSDLAFSAGYKLNDRSVAGIGVSYKLGWGENIRHIQITHEGVGIRSFLDVKLKGSFYASGGFEYNYQQPFNTIRQLYGADNWQQSGLIGVSKVVAVQSKLFKKTKVQLLWDFLSYEQIPRSQPIKFRVGYSFN
ncbi:MAG TPA: hypothetical protein VEB40_01820 [Flavipsychrobacter sp.]|nr:hypothetical protein [Flavipsychrobacter sp.]